MKPIDPYDIKPLIARVHAFAKQKGVEPITASRLVFGDWHRLKRIEEEGKTLTLETAVKAWRKLDELEAQLRQTESAA